MHLDDNLIRVHVGVLGGQKLEALEPTTEPARRSCGGSSAFAPGASATRSALERLGDEIVVAAVLPAVPDHRAREVADELRQIALRARAATTPGFTDDDWPSIRAVATVSLQACADGPLLLQEQHRDIRREKAQWASRLS